MASVGIVSRREVSVVVEVEESVFIELEEMPELVVEVDVEKAEVDWMDECFEDGVVMGERVAVEELVVES